MTDEANDCGWAMLGDSRKFHYYDHESRSLCGRYRAFGPADAFTEHHGVTGPDDCKACAKKVDAHIKSRGNR